jgi:hypothetical protein
MSFRLLWRIAAWIAIPGLATGVASLFVRLPLSGIAGLIALLAYLGAALTASTYWRDDPWFVRAVLHAWAGACLGFAVSILPPITLILFGKWSLPTSVSALVVGIPLGTLCVMTIFVGGFGSVLRVFTNWRGEPASRPEQLAGRHN